MTLAIQIFSFSGAGYCVSDYELPPLTYGIGTYAFNSRPSLIYALHPVINGFAKSIGTYKCSTYRMLGTKVLRF